MNIQAPDALASMDQQRKDVQQKKEAALVKLRQVEDAVRGHVSGDDRSDGDHYEQLAQDVDVDLHGPRGRAVARGSDGLDVPGAGPVTASARRV